MWEQDSFQWADDVRFVLNQHTAGFSHILTLCSYSLMLHAKRTSSIHQFYSLWSDPTRFWTMLNRIFILLTHWNNSLGDRHVGILWHIILIQRPTSTCSYILILHAKGEAAYTNFIVFSLTQTWPELTMHHTQGIHAKDYANDAVKDI